ncbi:UTRA domain-containing protein [Streptomyces cinereoruber]|uniref:UTRA domain-containing protein n=1 Tax=Streptomyces cinereoruber TaxID=67260 RepID=UPI0036384187
MATTDKITGGVYGALIAAGHTPTTASETVSARPPTEKEATDLGIGGRVAVITVERVTKDHTGRPIEVLRAVAPADRLRFVYDDLPLSAPSGATVLPVRLVLAASYRPGRLCPARGRGCLSVRDTRFSLMSLAVLWFAWFPSAAGASSSAGFSVGGCSWCSSSTSGRPRGTHRFWVTDADRDRLEDHNSGRPVLPPAEPEDERDLPTGASHRAPTCRPSVQSAAPFVESAVALLPIPIQPLPSRPIGAWPFAPSIPAQPAPRPKPSAAQTPAIPRQPGPQDRAEERLLDWRSSIHWSSEPRPCRYCSVATNLRDEQGVPSRKTCAEALGGRHQRSAQPGV